MKYVNKNLILTLLVIVVFYCVCCADKLRLTKTPFTGDQLKIDGYYYNHLEGGKYYYPLILYSNGIILSGGGKLCLKSVEDSFLDKKWIENVKNYQTWWGIFRIEGNSIKIETWYHSSSWWHIPACIESGKIINDTTFVLTSVERSSQFWSKGSTKKNEIYHFRKFSPKPDSTNRFIK